MQSALPRILESSKHYDISHRQVLYTWTFRYIEPLAQYCDVHSDVSIFRESCPPLPSPLILIILSLLTRTTLAAPAPSTPAPQGAGTIVLELDAPHPIQQPLTGRYFYPAHGTDIP